MKCTLRISNNIRRLIPQKLDGLPRMGRSLKSADVAVVVAVVALAAISSITVRQPTLEAWCTGDQFLIVDINSDGTSSVLSLG